MKLKIVAVLLLLSMCFVSCKVKDNNSSGNDSFQNESSQNESAQNESSGGESSAGGSSGSSSDSSEGNSTGGSGGNSSEETPTESTGNPLKTSTGMDITVVDGITYVGGILIANKTYALPASYNPGKILDEAYNAFVEMKNAAASEGINLHIESGFRSYYEQNAIYNNYVSRDGKAEADRYSARPGHSEHQSGLALDLNMLYTSFGQTKEGIWLKNNCHKYGFIIRYPEGKEHITGYMYEPWHVRFIGKDMAAKVFESGLCLEEYLGIISKYVK